MAGVHVSIVEQIQSNRVRYAGGKVRILQNSGRTEVDGTIARILVEGIFLCVVESTRTVSEDWGVTWKESGPETTTVPLANVQFDSLGNILATNPPSIIRLTLSPVAAP
ncbi:MAG: hypothetical protein AAB473_02700 [Patescibacteria group bacterium]